MFKLRKKKFTLIELIVVVLLLGVLMRIAVPRFSGTTQDFTYKADASSAQGIVRDIESKVLMGIIDLEDNDTVTIYPNGTTTVADGGENLFGDELPEPQIKVDGETLQFKVTLIKGTAAEPSFASKTYLQDYTTRMSEDGEHHWVLIDYVFEGEEDTVLPDGTFDSLENGQLLAMDVDPKIE